MPILCSGVRFPFFISSFFQPCRSLASLYTTTLCMRKKCHLLCFLARAQSLSLLTPKFKGDIRHSRNTQRASLITKLSDRFGLLDGSLILLFLLDLSFCLSHNFCSRLMKTHKITFAVLASSAIFQPLISRGSLAHMGVTCIKASNTT